MNLHQEDFLSDLGGAGSASQVLDDTLVAPRKRGAAPKSLAGKPLQPKAKEPATISDANHSGIASVASLLPEIGQDLAEKLCRLAMRGRKMFLFAGKAYDEVSRREEKVINSLTAIYGFELPFANEDKPNGEPVKVIRPSEAAQLKMEAGELPVNVCGYVKRFRNDWNSELCQGIQDPNSKMLSLADRLHAAVSRESALPCPAESASFSYGLRDPYYGKVAEALGVSETPRKLGKSGKSDPTGEESRPVVVLPITPELSREVSVTWSIENDQADAVLGVLAQDFAPADWRDRKTLIALKTKPPVFAK